MSASSTLVPMASGGLFSWLNTMNAQTVATIHVLGTTLVMICILSAYLKAHRSLPALIMAGAIGAFVIYLIFNIVHVSNIVGNTVNSPGALAPAQVLAPSAPASLG